MHICDKGQLDWLISLPYTDPSVLDAIASELETLAKHSDVQCTISGKGTDYNDCLHAFLCGKHQFQKAAARMYRLNQRIEGAEIPTEQSLDAQLRTLAKAISTLELLPEVQRAFLPSATQTHQHAKRSLGDDSDTKVEFGHDEPAEIITIEDLRNKFSKVVALRNLLAVKGNAHDMTVSVQSLLAFHQFEAAYTLADATNVDPAPVIKMLTQQCCELREMNTSDSVAVSYGPRATEGASSELWDLLQDLLARYDAKNVNFRLHDTALEVMLSFAAPSIPEWFITSFAGSAISRQGIARSVLVIQTC